MFILRLLASTGRPISRLSSTAVIPPLPESQQKVVVADGGRTIVCWHPEEPFPYEFTKPLPAERVVEETSLLKDLELKFKDYSEEEVRSRLMKMTSTPKHVWFPKARLRKTKPSTRARDYL